jgi:hypothetical protein
MSRPAVALFTETGRLVASSESEPLVRSVASLLLEDLPPAGDDPDAKEILKSRKKVLVRIAGGVTAE